MPFEQRKRYVKALEQAKILAYEPGQFVGQESFMTADEILSLARSAGIDAGSRVLDLCCGVGGPGLHVAGSTQCHLLGVDSCSAAVELAREDSLRRRLQTEFMVAEVPPSLNRRFDTVMLLETMLAFRDKRRLLAAVADLLETNGTFLFTLEEGEPLCEAERASMPESDTVWLTPLSEMKVLLQKAGFSLKLIEDHTPLHCKVAEDLADSYAEQAVPIRRELGEEVHANLIRGHRLWASWLRSGRARKFALVARK